MSVLLDETQKEISVIFFFKQKTAYEMRISDWSSDVCSSDLDDADRARQIVKRLLSVAIEQPRAAQPCLQFLEEQHQRAFARDLQAFDDELIFRPPRIGGELARRDDLDPVLGPEGEARRLPLPRHPVDQRIKIRRASCRERGSPYGNVSVVA